MSDVTLPVERVVEAPGNYPEPAGWQQKLLAKLGVTKPTAADIAFFTGWFEEEHGDSGYTGGAGVPGQEYGGVYNPFDTTLRTGPGDTQYNSVGVQNYPTPEEGYDATVQTLEGSNPGYGYGAIVTGLRSGASLTQLEEAENASSWGSAFPNVGSNPAPLASPGSANPAPQVSAAASAQATTASAGIGLGSLADSFAQGILSGLRDMLEIAGGAALVVLGVYLIMRDLEGAGVPTGLRQVRRFLRPGPIPSEPSPEAVAARTEGESARVDAARERTIEGGGRAMTNEQRAAARARFERARSRGPAESDEPF